MLMKNKPDHIFIVGVGRSGTKFLMNVLNNHSEINISSETHFFSKLIHNGFIKVAKKFEGFEYDRNLKKLVEAMFNRSVFGTFWKHPLSIEKERILDRFKQSKRTFKDFFSIIIEEDKLSKNKSIAGEKTPSHLYHIDNLIKWFPNAKILHIIRDPRFVLASEIHKDLKTDYPLKKESYFYNLGLFFYVLIQWFLALRLDKKFEKKYPTQYLSIKYEDLLNDHERKVKYVCSFLNVKYEESMLNPPIVDSSYQERNKKNSRRVAKITPVMEYLLTFFLRNDMRKLGYL